MVYGIKMKKLSNRDDPCGRSVEIDADKRKEIPINADRPSSVRGKEPSRAIDADDVIWDFFIKQAQ